MVTESIDRPGQDFNLRPHYCSIWSLAVPLHYITNPKLYYIIYAPYIRVYIKVYNTKQSAGGLSSTRVYHRVV